MTVDRREEGVTMRGCRREKEKLQGERGCVLECGWKSHKVWVICVFPTVMCVCLRVCVSFC